jgi:CheY-like chemotaxis protein
MAKILVIEDNFEIRENTSELLELEGHEIVLAINGREGINLAKQHLPDIILCDIMMPEADGYTVFSELKDDKSTSGISFIFVTASAEQKEIRAGLEMGANAYIRKPFQMEELILAINRCLPEKK